MTKWDEPQTKDLLAALHRIERVADVIASDDTPPSSASWNAMRANVMRANEIKELARMAVRMAQGAPDDGK